MHQSILFFVLLFLPNTTLTDWQAADAPNLHQLITDGAVGLVNARTAEDDKITLESGEYTIFAGERVKPSSNGQYTHAIYNLENSLTDAGVDIQGPAPVPLMPAPRFLPRPDQHFVTAELNGDWGQIDDQIARYADLVRKNNGILMIVSPNPTIEEFSAYHRLTPALLWGTGVPPGYLVSPSTRTSGLITNTDIAPTVASLMGASLESNEYGASINVLPSTEDKVSVLLQRESVWANQELLRTCLPYIAGMIALLVLAAIFAKDSSPELSARIAATLTVIPLVLLLSTSLPLLIGLLVLALVISLRVLKPADTSFFAAASILIMVTVDTMLFSGKLTSGSLLGYSVMEGARYYGIGNEIMGAFIGALVVITAMWEAPGRNRAILITMWIVAGIALAMPTDGAKAGGLMVCLFTAAGYASVARGHKLSSPFAIILLLGSLVISLALLIFLSHIGPETHVGGTLAMAKSGGFNVILATIARKTAMEFHLVFHSVWILVLLTTIYGRYRLARTDIAAKVGTAATLACFLFNDSGVLAAAICSLIIWVAELNDAATAQSLVTNSPSVVMPGADSSRV